MAELTKLTDEIIGEAKAEAAKVLADARERADGILSAAKAEAEADSARQTAEANKKAEALKTAGASNLEQRRKQAVLAAKQAAIAETLEIAKRQTLEMPDDAYFGLLTRVIAKRAHIGEGELRFGEKDLARVPSGFAAALAKALPNGADLRVSGEAAPIDNGFVLIYGATEENCAVSALFREKREEMTDVAGSRINA